VDFVPNFDLFVNKLCVVFKKCGKLVHKSARFEFIIYSFTRIKLTMIICSFYIPTLRYFVVFNHHPAH